MKSFCAQHLPSYMSPDVFLFLEAFPRTSTDKVDYQGLTRLAHGCAGPNEVVMHRDAICADRMIPGRLKEIPGWPVRSRHTTETNLRRYLLSSASW